MRHSASVHSEMAVFGIPKDSRGGVQTLIGIRASALTTAGAAIRPVKAREEAPSGQDYALCCATPSDVLKNHKCSPSFAHASESKDQLLPVRATSSFTTVAGQGWLAGPKPSLDALIHVAAAGSAIKAGADAR